MDRKDCSQAEREDKADRGGHSPFPRRKSFPALAAALCCLLLAGCQSRVAGPPASSQASSDIASASNDAASSGQPQQAEESRQQQPQQEPDAPSRSPLEEAVLAAVLQENAGRYLPGEFQGAGCKIIETFQEGQETAAVYALINYTEYGFEDGRFVNLSGTGARVLIHFDLRTSSGPAPIDYTVLDPTSGLTDAQLEELMAPLLETGKEYLYTEEDVQQLRAQADAAAREYLQGIGRQAEVGERESHEESTLLALLDEQVYDRIAQDAAASRYPDWVGTCEQVEDGIRYVYETQYDSAAKAIRYTKTRYDTGEAAESLAYDAATGQRIA